MAFEAKYGRVPIKGKDIDPLYMGNIKAKRDWSHAEDMVRGMWLMMQQDDPDDYVLGSGETRTVENFLQVAFSIAGKNYQDFYEVDEKFYRPVDVNLLLADPSKARAELGWDQEVSFEELVMRMVTNDFNLARSHHAATSIT
jgi:GDPmannose 4,6-dehydratase